MGKVNGYRDLWLSIRKIFWSVAGTEALILLLGYFVGRYDSSFHVRSIIESPLPSVATSSHGGGFFVAILGHNIFLQSIFYLLAFVHLGLAPVLLVCVQVFNLGMAISWFSLFPGTSTLNGVSAYISHAVPELSADTLIISISIWIGLGWFYTEEGIGKWENIKARFRKSVKALPIIAGLLIIAAILETTISLPVATHYARVALESEGTKTWNASNGDWTVQIPESWTNDPSVDKVPGVDVQGIRNSHIPAIIEIRTYKEQGVYNWNQFKDLEIEGLKQSLAQIGVNFTIAPQDMMIGNKHAVKVTASGREQRMPNTIIVFSCYLIDINTNQQSNTTNTAAIIVRTPSPWYEFIDPVTQNMIETFQTNNV